MTTDQSDIVKQQVAAHWGRRAVTFDSEFGHAIATPVERAIWDRVFAQVLAGRGTLDALDCGCGTGFLCFELAGRGHRVTGIDFAPAMLVEARKKAAARHLDVRFDEADAEHLPFPPASFDLTISRHVLWTLPHPEQAIAEWVRVLRPGGRLAVIDGYSETPPGAEPPESARRSSEYAGISDRLPYLSGQSRDKIEAVLRANGLVGIGGDSLDDLVAEHNGRLAEQGETSRPRRRYVVWGDKPR